MKVLFCTDGSGISFNSLENFSNFICRDSVIVDIICAIDWSFLPDEVSIEESGFVNACANVADNILECSSKDIEEYGMKVGKQIKICGSAVDAILEQCKNESYDLILMGSHGRKGIQKWLGSVSRDVISNTKTPAYISKYKNPSKSVLFPVDGSEHSISGIKFALNNLDLRDKEILICMVNEDAQTLFLEGAVDTNWLMQIEKNQENYANNILKKVQKMFEKECYTVSDTIILRGNPAQVIIDYTVKHKIDMVCLTSRNATKFQKFLLGSISSRVLEYTPSDVLLCRIDSAQLDES